MTHKKLEFSIVLTTNKVKTDEIPVGKIVYDGDRIWIKKKKRIRIRRFWLKNLTYISKQISDYTPLLIFLWSIFCFWPQLEKVF